MILECTKDLAILKSAESYNMAAHVQIKAFTYHDEWIHACVRIGIFDDDRLTALLSLKGRVTATSRASVHDVLLVAFQQWRRS